MPSMVKGTASPIRFYPLFFESVMLKQVIVVRKDLNMRKGKMVAQGSHASLGAYLDSGVFDRLDWLDNGQTKICVGIDSELELIQLYHKAKELLLPAYLVLDKGLTEFKEPTLTAVGIGPADSELIDEVTGTLKLL
jgi:PTH2 family peptidyl-tRNA hydrolase